MNELKSGESDMYDDPLCDLIGEAMYSPGSADQQMEQRCDMLIRELDELCAFAANKETVDLVQKQRISVGQMLTRIQLVASFINAPQPGKLRLIQNG